MKSLIMLLLTLFLGLATTAAYNATFQLKGQYIPSGGVVIFKDIGGTLGPAEGLFCEILNNITIPLSNVYWTFPNYTRIIHPPQKNTSQYGSGSCDIDYIDNCTSLYYGGTPTERGQFHCVLEWKPYQIDHEIVPVNIVDLTIFNVTGPSDLIIAGDNITLSVSVFVEPGNTPIPYQWQLNEDDLCDSSTYKGTNTNTLQIINIQDKNKGEYRVSVAHSASRFTSNVTISVVTIRAHIMPSQDKPPYLGESYALTCNDTVIGVDQTSLQSPTITYTWFNNSSMIISHEQNISFKSLTYEDTGNYSCQVSVQSTSLPHDLNDIASFTLITYDVIYQLSVDIFNDECKNWIHSDTKDKVEDINQKIVNKINSKCGESTTNVENGIKNDEHAFRCRTAQDGEVVYNVHLLQTANANTTKLVSCMNSWVTQTATIVVNQVEYVLNKACSGVLMDSDGNPFICPWLPPTKKSTLSVGEGIGIGLVTGAIITSLFVALIGILLWKYRHWFQGYNHPGK